MSRATAALQQRLLRPVDRLRVEEMTRGSPLFRAGEVTVALEVFDAATGNGRLRDPDYETLGAEADGVLVGWMCWGPTPCTAGTFDLYWIVVDSGWQGRGIGGALVAEMERRVAGRARLIVVETAGRADYAPTRAFYAARGYQVASTIADYYGVGDDLVTYVKRVWGLELGVGGWGFGEGSSDPQPPNPNPQPQGEQMSTWQDLLRQRSITSIEALAERFGPEHFPVELHDKLRQAIDNFEFRISPPMVDLIKSPDDPIWRQYIPTVQELDVVDGIVDSLSEDRDSPVPNITHRYPDRALFLVSPVCASYCRFCTRRRKVGDPEKIPMSQFESAFQYLEAHTEIRDVIMSGGDPLMLSDRRLGAILTRLRAIPHLEIIRIGSRVPCHLPERITPELCDTLKQFHPLFINTHFNHPDELTPSAVTALGMLVDAGIPMGCQTVLLKGVNDTPEVMVRLMQRLLMARVRPYYIYMADQVAGGEHFRTTIETGLTIMKALRGWTSGLANPHFVIDAPGGGGKVPLLPEYVESIDENEVVMRNFKGERYVYKQPKGPPVPRSEMSEPEYLLQPL